MLIPTEARIAITKLRLGLPSKSPLAAAFIYSPIRTAGAHREAAVGASGSSYVRTDSTSRKFTREDKPLVSTAVKHPQSTWGQAGQAKLNIDAPANHGRRCWSPPVAARKIEQRRDG